MKFSFMVIIFVCWFTLLTAKNIQLLEILNYINGDFGHQCEDDIALNFSNTVITSIGQNFISSPLITCLNLTNIDIQSIQNGAFDKLPNLSQLFISNNNIKLNELFNFGGHEKLRVLILNNATKTNYYYYYDNPHRFIVDISKEYPNLEILSLCANDIYSVQTSIKETPLPKLKILDLSNNHIRNNNFLKLLSNSLYFLDLHNNSLTSLAFDKKQVNLLVLYLNNNNLKYVKYNNTHKSFDSYNLNNQYKRLYGFNQHSSREFDLYDYGLAMDGLENLHYLSISGNKIDFILSNAFKYTDKLVYLNLSINNINYLHPDIFENLQSLRWLDLSFNKFEDVPQISSEISALSLNCNNIKSLTANAFAQMPKLIKLFLAGNQIVEINVKAFTQLLFLEVLDLSKNKLSFLPKGWSESLMSLKYLILNDNKFISLESLSLTSRVLLSLMEVHLGLNPLEYLDVSYFKNLPQNFTVNLTQVSNFAECWNSNLCQDKISLN
ncbi:leucine-rich repeat-containing protein 70-like [Nylanderia fulva]|uniref:leucine-rich repeat-containing protein 70-like n=1 Tax=Nylanderia fulva TaxID=613905 RepID=UPI0010FAF23B|nr:leucine-rich repeat-containing protein 70-like [Nylanderia fulva]